MPVNDREPRTRLQAQTWLILDGLEGAAVWPPDWEQPDDVQYLYREHHLLVRDADVERVMGIVPSERVQHDDNLRGVTLLRYEEETQDIEAVCTAVDRTLGEGVVTPDHVFYLCTGGMCPATEAEEVPADAPPDPGVSTEPCDGHGVLVSVLDSGWLARRRYAALLAGGRDRRDGGSVRW